MMFKYRLSRKRRRRGFSLIEVNLAMLLVGLGMLVLFGLFPSSLREGENAITDTHAALFATTVLDGLRAKAGAMDWSAWTDPVQFGLTSDEVQGVANTYGQSIEASGAVSDKIEFPAGSETYVRYIMAVDLTERTRTVQLWVVSGEFATSSVSAFKDRAEWYFTRYYYAGGN
jgi:prepilin-type N-terminal cleavage/methylation domain-containing protein